MRGLTVVALLVVAAGSLGGCRKTGEGEYEVDKPVIGTEKDTINTPSVDVGTQKDTITVPTVTTEQREVTVPTVDVDPPKR